MTSQASPSIAQLLPVPAWVLSLFPRPGWEALSPSLRCIHWQQFLLATFSISNAVALDANALADAVDAAYQELGRLMQRSHASHPVRYWNFLPDIHADMGAGMDRYMAFNVGRHRAMQAQMATADCIPTASAVGHFHSDLVIHMLAATAPGRALSNPRQVDPVRYSSLFGPCPPCFSRATIVPRAGEASLLLIGGTASVCGELSMHVGNLVDQLEETCANLNTLVQIASPPATLDDLTHIRAYVPDPSMHCTISDYLRARFSLAADIELLPAELCRKDLLVEIEALAMFHQGS